MRVEPASPSPISAGTGRARDPEAIRERDHERDRERDRDDASRPRFADAIEQASQRRDDGPGVAPSAQLPPPPTVAPSLVMRAPAPATVAAATPGAPAAVIGSAVATTGTGGDALAPALAEASPGRGEMVLVDATFSVTSGSVPAADPDAFSAFALELAGAADGGGASSPSPSSQPAVSPAVAAVPAPVRASAPEPPPGIQELDLGAFDPDPAPTAPVSHARLVLDDAQERVIVTVAVRHGSVDVAVRTGNSELAGAVARSLDELDAALRGHGLALGDLVARDHREPPSSPPPPRATRSSSAPDVDAPVDTAHTPGTAADPRLRALA